MACEVCMGINSDRCPICGKEPEMKTCPDCDGTGYSTYWAIDIRTDEEVEVTPLVWSILPETKEEAESKRQNFIKSECEECQRCGGTGEVEDEDGPYDYFDEDAAMERYYERKYGNG